MAQSLRLEQAETPTRRKFPRVSMRCEFSVRDASGEFPVSTVDLSFGGAFLETDRPLLIGNVITLTLIKDEIAAETPARIVHRHKTGYGVAFIDPPDDFYDSLTDVLFDHVVSNVRLGAPEDTVPARIALFCDYPDGYRALFSTHINAKEIWVLTEEARAINETFWITIAEHGLFDCQVRVIWCGSNAMGLELVSPSEEFMQAYQRIFDSFLGQ